MINNTKKMVWFGHASNDGVGIVDDLRWLMSTTQRLIIHGVADDGVRMLDGVNDA